MTACDEDDGTSQHQAHAPWGISVATSGKPAGLGNWRARHRQRGQTAHVFGDEIGGRVGNVKRAWQTAVLRAHGHEPVWVWTRTQGPNDKGTTKLSPESQAAYRAINLHFHDLRHEGGSRLIEAGWPVHHVQHMLGHATL